MVSEGSKASVSASKTRARGRTALGAIKKQRNNLNVLIRKVKIKPYDYSTFPLGLFDKQQTPRGFCVTIDPDINGTDAVAVDTRTRPVHDKVEYSLTIANRSNKAFYAEISRL